MSRSTPDRLARLALAGWSALAAIAGLPAAGAGNEVKPYEGVDPGSVVKIDLLGGGRILEPLPFDVQFYFESPVLEDTTKVEGRYRGSKRPEFCAQLYPDLSRSQTAYLQGDPPAEAAVAPMPTPIQLEVIGRDGRNLRSVTLRPPPDAAPAVPAVSSSALSPPLRDDEQPITFVRFIQNAEGRREKVELSVPGVLPNRYYCFEFVLTRKPSDIATLRPALAEQIDQELRDPNYVEQTTSDFGDLEYRIVNTWKGIHQIRVALVDAVKAQLREGERIVAPAGSFLDPETPLRQVSPKYRDEFDRILEAQNGRFDRNDNFETRWKRADARLREILQNAAFQQLQANVVARQHMAGREAVLNLGADTVTAAAQGSAPGAGAPDLLAVWTAAALDPRVGRLNDTLFSLEELSLLLGRAQAPAFANSLGITPAAAGGLQALVTNVPPGSDGAIQLVRSVRDEVLALRSLLTSRSEKILDLVDQLSSLLEDTVRVQGTSIASYEVRAGWYISADVGQGWAGDLEELFTYVGTNIYFRPINKKAPLRGGIRKRFSIVVGITNEDLEKTGRLEGVIGKAPLIVGGGFRISDHFRLSAGALIFNELDPSPLVSTTELAASWFVSASIDWNVRRLFSRFGGAFGLNGNDGGND